MQNNYYEIYVNDTIEFVNSITIKTNPTAIAINKRIKEIYGPSSVNEFDPSTWKYYLNVSGQYHFTDPEIKIISLDTLEEINFTYDNLLVNRATRQGYDFGTRRYKELLEKYPDQELLINGILNPTDINKAINSSDGTILSYAQKYVEENEYSFINKVQNWIYGFMSRWDNPQFTISDNLYHATMLGILHLNLVPAIINIRLASCKTNEVHSYHLKQYLASNGLLDNYIDSLTKKQQLFLYRNIAYIKRNSGKNYIFDWLVDNILTQRNIPLAEYQMRHNTEEQPGQLKPKVIFHKKPINTEYNYDLKDKYGVNDIMIKERILARDNTVFEAEHSRITTSLMENSLSNKIKTKLLESSNIDYSNSEHFTYQFIALNHWAYLSSVGKYRSIISVESPSTKEVIALRADRAFELYVYIASKLAGDELTELPVMTAYRVIREPRPTVSDLMSVVNKDLIDNGFAQAMLDLAPIASTIISIDEFFEWSRNCQLRAVDQYKAAVSEQDLHIKAQKHNLITRCWSNTVITLGRPGQTYDQWFLEQNINISNYSNEQLQALAEEIANKAMSLDRIFTVNLKRTQSDLIKLVSQLSSYSIHFSSSINETPIYDAPSVVTRVGKIDRDFNAHLQSEHYVDVISSKLKQDSRIILDTVSKNTVFDLRMKNDCFRVTYSKLGINPKTILLNYNNVCKVGSRVYSVGSEVPGYSDYLNLTEEEKQQIKSVWN